jgi:predicted nuclease of predicted toxin-antitoxin system
MRFLVDAQLPPALARFLEAHGCEAKSARDVGLREAEDATIWSFALAGKWIVVTKDEDFAERTIRVPSGPQVLWLRIGNSTNRVLFAWLEPLLPQALLDLQAGHRLVELTRRTS